MQIQHTIVQTAYNYPLHKPYKAEDILLFDIETTGFSPKTSKVYLIGCMYYKDGSWQLDQWLNDEPAKESQLISDFTTFLKKYKRIVHYNGNSFDIPFLQKKAAEYGLPDPFSDIESFDLYKQILPLKKLLSLESLKLKAIEIFLGLKREDNCSGEELIPIYSAFLGRLTYERLVRGNPARNNTDTAVSDGQGTSILSPGTMNSQSLKDVLLLHNLEDVKNLIPISELLLYKDVLNGDFLSDAPASFDLSESSDFITFTLPLSVSLQGNKSFYCPLTEKGALKKNLTWIEGMALKVQFTNSSFSLTVPVYEGVLKHFLTPVSDYYYLPLEDMAVHKSVSQYVDKEFRQKATFSNCYLKKEGKFIPVWENSTLPIFKMNYSDRITYFDKNILSNLNETEIITYAKNLLNYFKEFFHI